MNKLIQKYEKQIESLAQEQGIKYLAIFGSQAREAAHEDSDIDLLVEYNNPVGLLYHADVQLKLEEILQRKVDLLTKKSISPKFRQYIEPDIQVIYEKP